MKLYTRTGDDGTTGLFGGQRVGKDDHRVEAYGSVDELNAALGVAAAAGMPSGTFAEELRGMVRAIQAQLFEIGADLATPAGSRHEGKIHRVGEAHVLELERLIDRTEEHNEPLTTFVLPGGTDLAARLHLARAICRRAERRVVTLGRSEPIGPDVLRYLNRLGDLLFALARRANREAGIPDAPWVS